MLIKIGEIIKKISGIRLAEDSYLKTTHFTVFLLFGYAKEAVEALEQRAYEIIVDKKAIAILPAGDAGDIVAQLRAVLGAVAESGVDLHNLNDLRICPLIIGEAAEPRHFAAAVESLDAFRRNNDLRMLWKPFIILGADDPSAGEWLDIIMEKTAAPGGPEFCRCCLMTRYNEEGRKINDEHLMDTMLFISLLHANVEVGEGIAHLIAYRQENPAALFYTAQTVFIANPVIMRTLRCMHMLLERLGAGGGAGREPDMGFAQKILAQVYNKLPHEGNMLSFAPLYGVMPEIDGHKEAFISRLRDFSRTYYLSQFAINKKDIFAKFRDGFLRAFIDSGQPEGFLSEITGNTDKIKRLSYTTVSFQSNSLQPLSQKSGMSAENAAIYTDIENRLRTKLNRIGSELLEEFFSSEYFISLPGLYSEARKMIKNASAELKSEVSKREHIGAEIHLDLIGGPDEELVAEAAKELTAGAVLPRCIAGIVLALETKDEAAAYAALAQLLDELFESVRGLAGGGGAQKYMELLSNTCQSPNSAIAKKCVAKIGKQLIFPIRLKGANRKKSTFVWGNQENMFYAAWENHLQITGTVNEFLPVNSQERFVLLTVSTAFTRGDILGIAGIKGECNKERTTLICQ